MADAKIVSATKVYDGWTSLERIRRTALLVSRPARDGIQKLRPNRSQPAAECRPVTLPELNPWAPPKVR